MMERLRVFTGQRFCKLKWKDVLSLEKHVYQLSLISVHLNV